MKCKNSFAKSSKVLAAYAGCMAIVFGLALPAYGQIVSGETESYLEDAGSTISRVRLHLEGATTGSLGTAISSSTSSGVTTYTGGQEYHVARLNSIDYYYATEAEALTAARNDMKGVGQTEADLFTANPSVTPTITLEMRGATTPTPVVSIRGGSAVAIGAGSEVIGQDSIAFGRGAQVKSESTRTVTTMTNVHTGNFEDSAASSPTTHYSGEVTLDGSDTSTVYFYDSEEDAAEAVLYGLVGDGETEVALITASELAGNTITFTVGTPTTTSVVTAVGVEGAVAIGAGSEVTGDNGIAIGFGVEAGENEIVIGGATTGKVEIGGINLRDIGDNAGGITANDLGIVTNRNDIATNRSDIAENKGRIDGHDRSIEDNKDEIITHDKRIKTNTAGIATNAAGINTNRAGIAMAIAFSHLPSVSAGDRGSWGIGAGSFDGKTALAVGMTYRIENNGQIKVGISSSGGETSFGIGFGKGF